MDETPTPDWHVQYRKGEADHVEWFPTPEHAIEAACVLIDNGCDVHGIWVARRLNRERPHRPRLCPLGEAHASLEIGPRRRAWRPKPSHRVNQHGGTTQSFVPPWHWRFIPKLGPPSQCSLKLMATEYGALVSRGSFGIYLPTDLRAIGRCDSRVTGNWITTHALTLSRRPYEIFCSQILAINALLRRCIRSVLITRLRWRAGGRRVVADRPRCRRSDPARASRSPIRCGVRARCRPYQVFALDGAELFVAFRRPDVQVDCSRGKHSQIPYKSYNTETTKMSL
jgi:hypothetical protein